MHAQCVGKSLKVGELLASGFRAKEPRMHVQAKHSCLYGRPGGIEACDWHCLLALQACVQSTCQSTISCGCLVLCASGEERSPVRGLRGILGWWQWLQGAAWQRVCLQVLTRLSRCSQTGASRHCFFSSFFAGEWGGDSGGGVLDANVEQ